MWPSDIVGGLLWAIGFTIETTADFQKFAFKQNPANKGRFISTGKPPIEGCARQAPKTMYLWAISFLCRYCCCAAASHFCVTCGYDRLFVAGVWKYARYPNYGGEMLVWWGLWLISIPVLDGGYWVCVVCGLTANLLTLGAHYLCAQTSMMDCASLTDEWLLTCWGCCRSRRCS